MMNSVFSKLGCWFRSLVTGTLVPLCGLLRARKASVFFLFFLLSACILAHGNRSLRFAIPAVMVGSILFVLILFIRRRSWYAVLLPLLFGILLGSGMSCVLFEGYIRSYITAAERGDIRKVTAEVQEVVYTNAYSGTYICSIRGNRLPYRVLLTSSSPDLEPGQVLDGAVLLTPWEDADDGFDEKQYYLSKGVVIPAEDKGLTDTGTRRFSLTGLFQRWNSWLSARITAHVAKDGLPTAMLLGNRSALEDSVKRDFRRLGILHLIAVSGTHFSLLHTMTQQLLIRVHIRPGKRNLMMIPLTVLYMLLTGMSASVVRAGLMHLIALLCQRLELRVRYFSALNLACGLVLLLDPFAALDAGLHLSYLAVCGCLLSMRLEREWPAYRKLFWIPSPTGKHRPSARGWRRYFSPRILAQKGLSMLLLNFIITCLTLPLSWLYFGEMSLLGLLANLLYIPATGVLLFLTLVYLLLYPIGIFTLPLAGLLSGFSALLETVAEMLSTLPHISVSLLYPFIPLFLIPLAVSVCILPWRKHKLRGIFGSFVLLSLMVITVFGYEAAIRPQSVAVYRNDRLKDGFAVRSDGEILLIDVSDGSYNFTSQLLEEARKLYATELDGYMLTHYHNRHVGTLEKLADRWILRTLYLPQPVTETEWAVYRSLVECAGRNAIETVVFSHEFSFGHLTLSQADRVWLSRSTHPITGLSLAVSATEQETERLVYASSSFSQGDPEILAWMEDASFCIFGAHSPIHKKTFAVSLGKAAKAVVWNGDSADYGETESPADTVHLQNCRRLVYRFADAGKSG